MFTLSSVNAVLNALVIGIFMPDKVIVLYEFSGAAVAYGSKWCYLIYVAIPLIISGSLLISEKMSKKSNPASPPDSDKPDDEDDSTNALDEFLTGNTPHKDNISVLCIWFFAILSWVMTGIALNNIENVSIILPSIIVIMLSAATIFMTSLHGSSSSTSISGIHLKWLENKEVICKKSNRFSLYAGMLSGMLGVCLAAWSLVISNNIPNCIAIAQLVLVAFIFPILYSYILYKKSEK